MSEQILPFTAPFDLGRLSESGTDVTLAPAGPERDAIAQWLEIEALPSLTATIRLRRTGDDAYAYAGSFAADVVQACVVTLEPVSAHISGEFRRSFKQIPRVGGRRRVVEERAPATIELSSLEDDDVEMIESTVIDLAAPLLEEVSLALAPYPRAPGVEFDAPEEEKSPADNPFAVLEGLKSAATQPVDAGSGKKRN